MLIVPSTYCCHARKTEHSFTQCCKQTQTAINPTSSTAKELAGNIGHHSYTIVSTPVDQGEEWKNESGYDQLNTNADTKAMSSIIL